MIDKYKQIAFQTPTIPTKPSEQVKPEHGHPNPPKPGPNPGPKHKDPVNNDPPSTTPDFAKTADARSKEYSDMFYKVKDGQMIYTEKFWRDLAWASARDKDADGKEIKTGTINPQLFVNFLVAAYGLPEERAWDIYDRAAKMAMPNAPKIAARQGLLVDVGAIDKFTAALKSDPIVGDSGTDAGKVANGPQGPTNMGDVDPNKYPYLAAFNAGGMNEVERRFGYNAYNAPSFGPSYGDPFGYPSRGFGDYGYNSGGGFGGAPQFGRGGGNLLGTVLDVVGAFSRGGGGYGGGYGDYGGGPSYRTPPFNPYGGRYS